LDTFIITQKAPSDDDEMKEWEIAFPERKHRGDEIMCQDKIRQRIASNKMLPKEGLKKLQVVLRQKSAHMLFCIERREFEFCFDRIFLFPE